MAIGGGGDGSDPNHRARSPLQDTLPSAAQRANGFHNFIRVIKRVSAKRSPSNFINSPNAEQKLPTNCKLGKQ